MIIAVSGIAYMRNETAYRQEQSEYKQKFYQPTNKADLQRKVARDFEKELTAQLSKYHIDILIQGLYN